MEKEEFREEINLLKTMHADISEVKGLLSGQANIFAATDFIYFNFKGAAIYLLFKAFIDSGGAPHENYRSFFEKVVPFLSNKTQRGFSPQSFTKFSDKVDPESKETVKRFLQKMIRNIDSYD